VARTAKPKSAGPEPIRVRLYGLVALTRERYLFQAVCGAFGLVLMFAIWLMIWPRIEEGLPHLNPGPLTSAMYAVLAHLPWVLVGLAAFKAVEVAIVLQIFARKEAERKARPEGRAYEQKPPEGGSKTSEPTPGACAGESPVATSPPDGDSKAQ
jgi:hypothetical protein